MALSIKMGRKGFLGSGADLELIWRYLWFMGVIDMIVICSIFCDIIDDTIFISFFSSVYFSA
jgi:hypothetical protein